VHSINNKLQDLFQCCILVWSVTGMSFARFSRLLTETMYLCVRLLLVFVICGNL